MRNFVNYFKRWNAWRKNSTNSLWHKLLVLLKLRRSPTFEMYFGNIPDSTIFLAARSNGKSGLAMELYRKKIGIPDDVWEEMKREVEEELYGKSDEQHFDKEEDSE